MFGSAQKEWGHLTNPQLRLALLLSHRVGNFRQKNNSAEDGIDRTYGYFRRNSGCSAEQKTLGIPFRTIPRKRKQLGIPFRRTKIVTNTRNPFRTLPQKSEQPIPFRETKIEANSRNAVPNHSAKEKRTQNKKSSHFIIYFRRVFVVFVSVTICCGTPNSGLKERILFLEIF